MNKDSMTAPPPTASECICDQPRTQPITVCPVHPHAWKRGKAVGREVTEEEYRAILARQTEASPPNAPTAAEVGDSGTYGELPDEIRSLLVNHDWDNLTRDEQRAWLIRQLAAAHRRPTAAGRAGEEIPVPMLRARIASLEKLTAKLGIRLGIEHAALLAARRENETLREKLDDAERRDAFIGLANQTGEARLVGSLAVHASHLAEYLRPENHAPLVLRIEERKCLHDRITKWLKEADARLAEDQKALAAALAAAHGEDR